MWGSGGLAPIIPTSAMDGQSGQLHGPLASLLEERADIQAIE